MGKRNVIWLSNTVKVLSSSVSILYVGRFTRAILRGPTTLNLNKYFISLACTLATIVSHMSFLCSIFIIKLNSLYLKANTLHIDFEIF